MEIIRFIVRMANKVWSLNFFKTTVFSTNMFLLALFLAQSGCGWGMRLSHWQEMQIDFLCTGTETRQAQKETNIQKMVHNLVTNTHPTLNPFGQLSGKQDVGQLALCVGPDRVVGLLAAQVIKLDLAQSVSYGWQVDDPGWGWMLQQVQQQKGQEEMTWRGRQYVEGERVTRSSEWEKIRHTRFIWINKRPPEFLETPLPLTKHRDNLTKTGVFPQYFDLVPKWLTPNCISYPSAVMPCGHIATPALLIR